MKRRTFEIRLSQRSRGKHLKPRQSEENITANDGPVELDCSELDRVSGGASESFEACPAKWKGFSFDGVGDAVNIMAVEIDVEKVERMLA